MSSPSDDFFGIKYVSSNSEQQSSSNVKEKPAAPSPSEKEMQEMTGTEYLDNAFFPGISERSKPTSVPSDSETAPTNDFEDQYFGRRISEQEAHNNRMMGSRQPTVTEEEEFPVVERVNEKRKKKIVSMREMSRVVVEEQQGGAVSGLSELRATFPPVWHMSDDDLVDFLAQRVVYSDANLIAFDKPCGLAYSGGPNKAPQFDRILQRLKSLVAPKVERLHLVRSLDKHQSGIILFATNKLIQSEMREIQNSEQATMTHRCLVRRGDQQMPLNVTIPLVKKIDKEMKFVPLLSNNAKGDISYGETSLRVLTWNKTYVGYVEATTKKEVPHQLRCHLQLAGMPLIGDGKYSGDGGRPPRLSNVVLRQLAVTENHSRKLPIYSHLMKMEFPSPSAKQAVNIRITAPVPHHFTWILRKLRLLKR